MTVTLERPTTTTEQQEQHPHWCCIMTGEDDICSAHVSGRLAFVAATGAEGVPVEQAGLAVFPAISIRAFLPEDRAWRRTHEPLVNVELTVPVEASNRLECGDRYAAVELPVAAAERMWAALLAATSVTVTGYNGVPRAGDLRVRVASHANGVQVRTVAVGGGPLVLVLRLREAAEVARGIAAAVACLTEPIRWATWQERYDVAGVAA